MRRRCSSSTTDSLYRADANTNGKHNCKERVLKTRTPGLVKLLRAYRKKVRRPKPIALHVRSTFVLYERTNCTVSLQNYQKRFSLEFSVVHKLAVMHHTLKELWS